jgi:DNA-binding MarR family transcriptional regulator
MNFQMKENHSVDATDIDFDIENYVPYLLNRAGGAVVDKFVEGLKPHDLTLPMWRTLAMIYRHGPLRFGVLADYTLIELPTLSRNLDTMVDRGLIIRRRTKDDGRGVTVALTAHGNAIIGELIPHARAIEMLTFADLSQDEADFLRRLLRRVCRTIAPRPTDGPSPELP